MHRVLFQTYAPSITASISALRNGLHDLMILDGLVMARPVAPLAVAECPDLEGLPARQADQGEHVIMELVPR